MIRDKTEQNLMNVVIFQKFFVLAVCNALESRFEDNHIMTILKILDPTTMPSKQIGLANLGRGVVDLELLCSQYGVECEIGRRKIPSLINSITIKREFFVFKLQTITDWLGKSFKYVWSMIT